MPRVTITVPEKNSQPYRFQLDRRVVSLGRGSENDIAIDSGSVSVLHAEMHRIEGGYELRDVGSTNGIKLDGVRHEVIPLRNGSSVKIGDVAFDFMLNDEELQTLSYENPSAGSPIIREPELATATDPAPDPRVVYVPAPANSAGAILVFILLAAIAFFVGLSVRYQKETGGQSISSLYEAIKTKNTPASPPAK